MTAHRGRPTGLTGAWRALCDAAGGMAALAEALGVGQPTLWRWGKGYPMSPMAKRLVSAYAKRRRLADPTVGRVEINRPRAAR